MKNTIFIKILSGYLLISLILILSISIISYQIIKNHYLDTLRNNLINTGNILVINIKPLLIEDNYNQLDSYIKELGLETEYRLTVITPQGRVIADSERETAELENHRDRPEIITALQGVQGESIRFSTSVQADMLYKSLPVVENSEVIGIVRISIFLDRIDQLFESLRWEIFYIALIIFLIAFIGLYILSYRLTKPVRELSRAANRVSDGDFSVRVSSRSGDDIGNLCRSFNFMVSKIRDLISEITHSKDALDTIINTMQEGILVLNSNGQIELANESMQQISNSDLPQGRFYWEVIRQPFLSQLIRALFEAEGEQKKEAEIDDQHYICSVSPLPDNTEKLVLLYNITEIRKLDLLKKDIVANVSHELRSPLTAIKGFAETLEEEVTPEGKEYLDIISRNVNRLINIVNDLLTLSQLEQREIVEFKTLHIAEVINHIARVYRDKIVTKGLKLEIDISPEIPMIKGDEFRIEQLLVNLLENALQYTVEGTIKITARGEERSVVIDVDDTGSGIPPEHRKRIFERFYVVDKSRAKKYGGTGLGLAIVKHIALLHNGSVELQNKETGGSCFRVRLPV